MTIPFLQANSSASIYQALMPQGLVQSSQVTKERENCRESDTKCRCLQHLILGVLGCREVVNTLPGAHSPVTPFLWDLVMISVPFIERDSS